jgi:hypothetical protein
MLYGEDLLELMVRHNDRCLVRSIHDQCSKLDIFDADSAIELEEVSPSKPETWGGIYVDPDWWSYD